MWLLLILLGSLTYFMLKRSVAKITRTPIWLFWLVLMAPAFLWTAWFLVYGEDKPVPLLLLIAPFILCPLLCRWLIEVGRLNPEAKEVATQSPSDKPLAAGKGKEEPAALRPITASEEKSLRDCFPWDIYFLQQLSYHPQAIFCLGKLRAAPDITYQRIKQNVEKVFGDRFLVFFQEDLHDQPFFALVANPCEKSQAESEPITRPFLALGLLLLTLVTATWGAMKAYEGGSIAQNVAGNSSLLLESLSYSLSLIAILGTHELSHYLMAFSYKIRATLPYFIPFPFFPGTFGAYIQMRSPVPHRRALFDVAIAGPLGGFAITIPLLFWGLSLSEVVPLAEKSGLLNFEALDPRFSFLFAVFGKIALGSALVAGKAIALHPVAVAGYLGLLVTALNLIPVGQLDGGHIVHAMFGQRVAMIVGQLMRFFALLLVFLHNEFLLFAIFLLLMPASDRPALNDVTQLDDRRDFLGLLSLALLAAILLPLPAAIAKWWNF
jgi:membrane-associated protease RseP (regulator of RpoE activity)